MVNPVIMCRQHLIGEHGELHKFLPSFFDKKDVFYRFYPEVQIQFKGYIKRHNVLVNEMLRRGYNHKSPIVKIPDFKNIYSEFWDMEVDKQVSLKLLLNRCSECKERYNWLCK
jgi:hypothetical protein